MNADTAPITDDKTVASVQLKLRERGYVDVGMVDGDLVPKGKTEAAILDARNNLGLPLTPTIDASLIRALETAPQRPVSITQATATVDDISNKVEAVKANNESIKTSWWSKFTAWFSGIPATAILIVGQFDQAVPLISQVKGLFGEVPWQVWLIGFILLCIVFAIQAHKATNQSVKAEEAMVDGFQRGTVKPDAKEVPA